MDESIIQETIEFWERKAGYRMTPEEARSAIRNVVAYFDLLSKLDQEYKDRENQVG